MSLIQSLKNAVVGVIGRDRANRITAPYYDRQARRRTSERLAKLPAKDLQLNLGCGSQPLPGWVNVDIARGPQIDIVWDLTRGLPFPDESCSVIYSEHVIEHLSKTDAATLLRECFRVLQVGGVVRVSTLDTERFLRSYAGNCEFLHDPGFAQTIETPLDRINMMMRENGQHLWVYDHESLTLALRRAGFSTVVEQKFGESAHERLRQMDTPARAFETLYIEGIK
jgi:predicted SAM-dependent methyltransferase